MKRFLRINCTIHNGSLRQKGILVLGRFPGSERAVRMLHFYPPEVELPLLLLENCPHLGVSRSRVDSETEMFQTGLPAL